MSDDFEEWFDKFVIENSITDRGADGVKWACKEAFYVAFKKGYEAGQNSRFFVPTDRSVAGVNTNIINVDSPCLWVSNVDRGIIIRARLTKDGGLKLVDGFVLYNIAHEFDFWSYL